MRRSEDFEKSLICYLLPLFPAHFLLRHIKAPSVVWIWVTPTSPEGGLLFQPFPSPVFSFPKIRDDSGLSEFSRHSVSCRGNGYRYRAIGRDADVHGSPGVSKQGTDQIQQVLIQRCHALRRSRQSECYDHAVLYPFPCATLCVQVERKPGLDVASSAVKDAVRVFAPLRVTLGPLVWDHS